LARKAHKAGHELLVHLPMQPESKTANPGPHALLLSMNHEELAKEIEWNLDRFQGYVGVNNHMGSAFTQEEGPLHQVLSALAARGLLYLDSRTIANTATGPASAGLSLPLVERDIFIDNVQEERAIWAQLKKAEALARRRGYAVVIGHPHGETLKTLKAWIPTLKGSGVALVPLTAILDRERPHDLAQR
jgi:polysaccharide deacetylase 2 family uncharacterized protein YibQ